MPTKNCSNPNCEQINPQPISEFHKSKKEKSGLSTRCKSCRHTYNIKNREMLAEKNAIRYEKDKEKISTQQKQYYQKNRKTIIEKTAKYVKDNKEKVRVSSAIFHMENRERRLIESSIRQKNNRGAANARNSQYRASKNKATPKWLTEEQKQQIKSFYVEADRLTKETGIGHHVDHIIPLQGKEVSGLHVPWNLQILTKSENNIKNNKFDFTYENESWRK